MKKMNILVTGSKGQLGSEINELSGSFPEYRCFFTDVDELDICDKKAVSEYVEEKAIELIINCAAYTAVDKAETEPELADKINHLAVKNLAEIAKDAQLGFIHISTDYIFNGQGYKPYSVDHPAEPINIYGKTKVAGEEAMRGLNPENSMIIRTSWVYSSYGNNFVKTMLRQGKEREELNVISDQIGAPTYAKDFAKFILAEAVQRKNSEVEVFHFSNEGVCSWYDFAREIMEQANLDCKVKPIPASAYPTPAKRPFYSLMDKSRITGDLNYEIPHWKESLKECISKLYAMSN